VSISKGGVKPDLVLHYKPVNPQNLEGKED